MPSALLTTLVGFLPAHRVKNRLLNACGHDVHPRARVAPIAVLGGVRLVLSDRSGIGTSTVVRGLRELTLGQGARIGPSNWVSASPIAGYTRDERGCLIMGAGATVSTRHRLDCSGGIVLEADAAIAGWNTLVITHDVDPDTGALTAAPVHVGTGALVHAANTLSAGTAVAAHTRTTVGARLGPTGNAARPRPVSAVATQAVLRPEAGGSASVVHVLPTVDDAFGGPGPVLAAWLELDPAGRRSTVFATVTTPGPLAARLARICPTDFCRPGAVLGRFYGNLRQLRRISRAVKDADLVVSHSFFHLPGLVAGRAARRHGVPWVVAPHGSLDPWDVAQHHPAVKRRLTPLWRRLLRDATTWCITERESEQLVTYGARTARSIIPCPVEGSPAMSPDAALTHLGDLGLDLHHAVAAGGQIVSFVGRFDVKKGVARLIEAFDEAADDHDVLVLAGRGDEEWNERTARAADRAVRCDQIRRPGWLDPEGKRALWSLPGIFALTSENENFGVAVAEAMAAGRPVLVTDQVALCDLVRTASAGQVCDRTHAGTVKALAELLSDPAASAAAGRRGAGIVATALSPAAVNSRFQSAFDSAVQHCPHPPAHARRT